MREAQVIVPEEKGVTVSPGQSLFTSDSTEPVVQKFDDSTMNADCDADVLAASFIILKG